MKRLIIVLIVFTTGISSFAQKSKSNQKTDTVSAVYTCPMHPEVVSDQPGKCPKCNMDLTLSKKEQMKTEAMKTYTCPMHPEVVSNKRGDCPKCGMQLVERKTGKNQKAKIKSKTGMMSCCM